jgi:tetratricopeptide (TPR) repeat protein
MNERLVARGLDVADGEANLVLAYHRLGRSRDAEQAAERAIAADANHAAARFNLAVHYWESGNAAAAKQALEQLLARVPDHSRGRALMATIASGDAALAQARSPIDRGEFAPACREPEGVRAQGNGCRRGVRSPRDCMPQSTRRSGGAPRVRASRSSRARSSDAIERLAALLHRQGDRRRAGSCSAARSNWIQVDGARR